MGVRILCPAKINLFLSIGPLDSRSYHPIRSVFQAVSLFDELTIDTAGVDSFECDSDEVPKRNTVTRALQLAREAYSVPPLRISLRKRIPIQAGLGGGSSDAAGLLRALPLLLAQSSQTAASEDVARAVGADVPFFLYGGRAVVEGYGERIRTLPDGPASHFVLAKPSIGCPTAEMYRKLDDCPHEWKELPEGAFDSGGIDPKGMFNDFERVAPVESLALLAKALKLGVETALLCGSGSAIAALVPSQRSANEVASRLVDDGAAWSAAVHSLCAAEAQPDLI